jgi:uncharacterized membrane protein (DUF373 family)
LAVKSWQEVTELRTGRSANILLRSLQWIEDSIHILVAVLLGVIAIVFFIDVARGLVAQLMGHYDSLGLVLSVLDKSLVLFIVAELLHTVRITIRDHTLDAGPFLIIGLIAGIRRVLIVTAEAERSFQWNPQGIELVILILLILVMAVTILVWRRSAISDVVDGPS